MHCHWSPVMSSSRVSRAATPVTSAVATGSDPDGGAATFSDSSVSFLSRSASHEYLSTFSAISRGIRLVPYRLNRLSVVHW